MKRKEYLENAFKKHNEGKISAEAYDSLLENIENFCEENEEDEENDTVIVVRKGKNAYPILGKCSDFNIFVENLDDDDLQYIENILQKYENGAIDMLLNKDGEYVFAAKNVICFGGIKLDILKWFESLITTENLIEKITALPF